MAPIFLIIGALNGLLVVLLGAFAAHGLQHSTSPHLYQAFQTGIQYHSLHVPALLTVGLLGLHKSTRGLYWSGILFTTGILLFSGSLYLLGLTGSKVIGPLTPIGGVALICGWLLLAISCWRLRTATNGD